MEDKALQWYLNQNLNKVRKDLGKICSFISLADFKVQNKETGEWVRTNGFKVHVLNNEGGKDKVEIGLNKPFTNYTPQDFDSLTEMIKNKKYDTSKTV